MLVTSTVQVHRKLHELFSMGKYFTIKGKRRGRCVVANTMLCAMELVENVAYHFSVLTYATQTQALESPKTKIRYLGWDTPQQQCV